MRIGRLRALGLLVAAIAVVAVASISREDVWEVMNQNGYELRMNETLDTCRPSLKLTADQATRIDAAKGAREAAKKAMVQTKGVTLKAMIDDERQYRARQAAGASESELTRRRTDQQKYVDEYVQQRDIERAYRKAVEAALTEPQRVQWHAEAIRPELNARLAGKTLSAEQRGRVEPALHGAAQAMLQHADRSFALLLGAAEVAGKYVIDPNDPTIGH